jgi:glycosyltransferase involved in cell wall biosynthesis
MRAIVYDLSAGGHHSTYCKLILEGLLEVTKDVRFVTSKTAAASDEYGLLIKPLEGAVDVDALSYIDAGGPLKVAQARYRVLIHAVRRHRPDAVYLPTADGISEVIGMRALVGLGGLPASVHSEAMVHRMLYAYPSSTRLARYRRRLSLHCNAKAPWTKLHVVDVLAYETMQRHYPQMTGQMSIFPDALDQEVPMSKSSARESFGLPAQGRVIGAAGLMDRRKGIDLLMRAFAAASLEDSDRLLLVGKFDQETARIRDEVLGRQIANGRVVVVDRFVSGSELTNALAAMDLIVISHRRPPAISGILLRALAAQRPVLACDFGWVGRITKTFEAGPVVDVENEPLLAKELASALGASSSYVQSEGARRLVEFNSPQNFKACWTSAIRKKMNQKPSPNELTWEWVNQVSPTQEDA